MCLVTTDFKCYVAENDIPVAKIMYFDEELMSYFLRAKWELGVPKTSKLKLTDHWESAFDKIASTYYQKVKPQKKAYVSVGLHAWLIHHTNHVHRVLDITDDEIVAFNVVLAFGRVPVGSKYYLDATGLIAADTMIIDRYLNEDEYISYKNEIEL